MANPAGPPTAFDSLIVGGTPTRGTVGIPLTSGNVYFCDYANGSDGNTGTAVDPFKTVYWAYSKTVSGRGDVVVVVSNGASTGSQRLSLANAQVANSAATAGTLAWAHDNTHLIGMCSPSSFSQRARLAPPTGTYTVTTFGSANFVVVTGNGCIFQNISVFNGFSTGGAAQIAWTDKGSRNSYLNCDFEGMGDTGSAADAGSRSFKLGLAGSGEAYFYNCNFGLDTITRGAANASLELAGNTPRNRFVNCTFIADASASSPFHILCTGAAAIDRVQLFQDCIFTNAIKSGATTMTAAISMTSASPGGLIVLQRCTSVGSTKWGDTNALANTYLDGGAPTAATSGLGVNPS